MKYLFLLAFLLFGTVITFGQIVDIPDANFLAALIDRGVDINGDGQIQVSEAEAVTGLIVISSQIQSVTGLNKFINLTYFVCSDNQITELDLSNLLNLRSLDCSENLITELDLSNQVNFQNLYCGSNQITELDLNRHTNLNHLECYKNKITELDLNNQVNLTRLRCYQNQLSELNITNLVNLEDLSCTRNSITELNLNNQINLVTLSCAVNQLTELDLKNQIKLESLSCGWNLLSELDLNIQDSLKTLYCGPNRLAELNLINQINLEVLSCNGNQLSELDLNNLINLKYLDCGFNQLTAINVNAQVNLETLNCISNPLTGVLDLSHLRKLNELYAHDNNFTSINIKNGSIEDSVRFDRNPALRYICADNDQLINLQTLADVYDMDQVQINSYCSFTPGEEFYTIQGENFMDSNLNGCNDADLPYPYLQFSIIDFQTYGEFVSNCDGEYSIYVRSGQYTIRPRLENSEYFNISPDSLIVDFPTDDSEYIQDWCITPIGIHNDLDITMVPLAIARPGFSAKYKINYKNKGTTILSGSIKLLFDNTVLDIVSATPTASVSSGVLLLWDYTDLQPFEEQSINVEFKLNSPMDDPPLNGNDGLSFSVEITPSEEDETPEDNVFTLNQTVVNSFDPNDKICLEGKTISPEMIGDYIHYQIRFENTGTADAINIVVKDTIDPGKLDISSLQIVNGSHPFVTRIKDNVVEFIFEDINLPFNDAENDGYIVFKIKSWPTLSINDVIENKAEIFFDFNFPIVTNNYETQVAIISSNQITRELNSDVKIYPNPASSTLIIESEQVNINQIRIYDISGRLYTYNTINRISEIELDISKLSPGVYIIDIFADQKIISNKIIIE